MHVQLKVILQDGRVAALTGTMVAIARDPVAVTNSDFTMATDTRRVPDAYAMAKLSVPGKTRGASLFLFRGGYPVFFVSPPWLFDWGARVATRTDFRRDIRSC